MEIKFHKDIGVPDIYNRLIGAIEGTAHRLKENFSSDISIQIFFLSSSDFKDRVPDTHKNDTSFLDDYREDGFIASTDILSFPESNDILINIEAFSRELLAGKDIADIYNAIPYQIISAVNFYDESRGNSLIDLYDMQGDTDIIEQTRMNIINRFGGYERMHTAIEKQSYFITNNILSDPLIAQTLNASVAIPSKQKETTYSLAI